MFTTTKNRNVNVELNLSNKNYANKQHNCFFSCFEQSIDTENKTLVEIKDVLLKVENF